MGAGLTTVRFKMAFATVFVITGILVGCVKDKDGCNKNSHTENGNCICDVGWFGWHCERNAAIECGPHKHGVENWCVCDSGWVGVDCNVYIGNRAGRYHVVGNWYSYIVSDPSASQSGHIDTVMEVTPNNDTLFFNNQPHIYGVGVADTSRYYRFGWQYTGNMYGFLTFHKTFDDSLFFSGKLGGMGGGTTTNLVGVKLQ